jgi:hypothetical protein
VAAFTGLGGSIPVDWVATFTGIRSYYCTFAIIALSQAKKIPVLFKFMPVKKWIFDGVKN